MKISCLKVKNFRGISDLEIRPEHLNFLIGPCGSGKTSVLKALDFALTGTIDVADIRKGCDSAYVYVEFEDGTTIERERKTDKTVVRCNGKITTAKSVKDYIQSKTDSSNADVYDAMLHINYFSDIDSRKLTELFLSILKIRINYEKLIEMIAEKEGKAVNPEQIVFMKKYFPEMPEVFDLDSIDNAYAKIYADRKTQNALLDAAQKKSMCQVELPKESKKLLEEKLYELAQEETAAQTYEKSLLQYERSLNIRKSAETKLDELKKQLLQYSDIKEPIKEEFELAKKHKAQFEESITKHQEVLSVLRNNNKLHKKLLDSLNTTVCPLCDKLKCTTDKSGLETEIQSVLSLTDVEIQKHESHIVRCREQIEMRNKIIDKYNDDVVLFTKKVALENQIKDFLLPKVLEKPASAQSFDKGKALEEKKSINAKLQAYAEYEAAAKYAKEATELSKTVALYNTALQYLDVKKGVRAYILKRVLSAFEAKCNEKAKLFRGDIEVSVQNENGIQFMLKTKHTNGSFVDMNSVSTGEAVFVVFLMTSVIKEITNAKYLVVDNLDKLDAKCMAAFVELLKKEDGYSNIFLGSVDHADTLECLKGEMTFNMTNLV